MKPGGSVPWLTTQQAAAHLGLTLKGFYHFLDRERGRAGSPLRVHWLRGRMRFRVADLDRCVEVEPQAREETAQIYAVK